VHVVKNINLKDNKHNSLHLVQKYARIFVFGHYLFLKALSFPQATLLEICLLLQTTEWYIILPVIEDFIVIQYSGILVSERRWSAHQCWQALEWLKSRFLSGSLCCSWYRCSWWPHELILVVPFSPPAWLLPQPWPLSRP